MDSRARGVIGYRLRVVRLAGVLALCLGPSCASAAPSTPPPWRVLILSGSGLQVPATATAVRALIEGLQDGSATRIVTLRTEVVDALSLDPSDHEQELLDLLGKKRYRGNLDLLIAVGESALAFASRHRAELWPDVPIVWLGAPSAFVGAQPDDTNAIGITLDLDEVGTIRLARRLQPDARRLVLIAGSSEHDRSGWSRLEAAAAREGTGLEVEALFGRPLRDVLDRVARLPRDSIVLYTTVSRDPDGQVLVPADVAEQLSRASAAPVYGVWESQLGKGIVGGAMESIADLGRRSAALALRILRGTPPGAVGRVPPPVSVPTVDWRQMDRFGLSEARLPAGAVILNRPPSIVRQHPAAVAAVSVALASQAALIVALLAQARRRRRAEAEAARQRAELAHAARLSAVGELTASIAHEINQPLGAILSNAEAAELFLAADPPSLERVRGILEDIRHEDQRASAVIREILGLARKQPLAPTPVSLNAVVGDILPLVAADARRRGSDLETDFDSALPDVCVDRTQLQQVVLNLALNALDAIAPPWSGDRRVRIQTCQVDGRVEVSVADTGPGLTAGDPDRVFDSFYTTKPKGLGLGLSIVRSIVTAHGGQVAVERDGGWTSFRVRLPALEQEPCGSEGR